MSFRIDWRLPVLDSDLVSFMRVHPNCLWVCEMTWTRLTYYYTADIIHKNIEDASLDGMEQALQQGGHTGKIEEEGVSGKRKIAARILSEMMEIDVERAMVVAKSWAAGVHHSSRRQEDTDFRTLEDYIPYRSLEVGYM